ncbi:MAG TPA: T9SS type A sorting domain-containing protein [Bacteroidales bacterium]|nr:T9SS type A sorting domain-containing protein [Bacteroidales bacterium]
MKSILFLFWLILLFSVTFLKCQGQHVSSMKSNDADYVQAFKDTLIHMADRSDNEYLKSHFKSIVAVINSKQNSSSQDTLMLVSMYNAFLNKNSSTGPAYTASYLGRKRPLILSWVSPTDGMVSFSWLTLPKDWDPKKKYPMYVQLHGLWSVAANSTEYLSYPYVQPASDNRSFEDGYLLSPWGRGNYWYLGISETDIWEGISALKNAFLIDSARNYLTGHSMGGYGAWSIAGKSPNTWAALGIYAGALWYLPYVLTDENAEALKQVPTYFVCGTNDNLLDVNEDAYRMLQAAGNKDLQFVTFTGGHEYTETNVYNMYLWMRTRVKGNQATITGSVYALPEIKLECSPNPASDHTTVNITVRKPVKCSVSIYNQTGYLTRQINDVTAETGTNSIQLDTSEFTRGVYFVKIVSGSGLTGSKLVIY